MPFLFALVLAFLSTAVAAMGSIVDAGGAAKAMARGAIVWDVRGTEAYFDGHLPGAVSVGAIAEALLDEKTRLFLPVETIAERLGGAGIDLKREIVVYGSGGSAHPYFAQFALEYFGAQNVHVFHDGYEGWRAARRPISSAAVTRRPVTLRPFANPSRLVTTGEVLARVGNPAVQFVDARSPAEFRGEQSEALHSGHIPGAINVPYAEQLVDPEAPRKLMMKELADYSGLRLKKRAALKKLYAGLDPRRETIVYCTDGIRASMTAAVLARLGFTDVRIYHASWHEYGNQIDAPVEE